jgi:hypothetical protein
VGPTPGEIENTTGPPYENFVDAITVCPATVKFTGSDTPCPIGVVQFTNVKEDDVITQFFH